ncbi:Uncharacterized conserved protein, DUF1501 family [Jannaschia faecimaris]|uniref:Uncharacterized conserved protein, DUF1501 family n=1 Tax=Jannaschia faecimaris TaxID=1244108 RepID=A0A1H3LHA3_9RHOB|nr:DUF1501 domain-containing protein [Jannaschia faecimaris]SDY63680.1 Uncharacterized conserved protein, DUF1501 family [Jannaschia faecimaris]
MNRINRRDVLTMLGCSAAAFPLMTPMAFAALPSDNRLVVVILRGAMDGMDALQPYGDPGLARLRPQFEIGPEAGATDLTGFHALHPYLSPLLPLWRSGDLGFVQAVSTPYRAGRSHFDGQDILEAGTAGDIPPMTGRDGWLNRLLPLIPGAHGRTAFAVGREEMLILRGPADHASWAPDTRLDMAPATADLLLHAYHDDPLFRESAEIALGLAGTTPSVEGKRGDALFGFAASQLRQDARIAALSLGGWDSHRGQSQQLRRAFSALSAGLLRLRADLGPTWDKTMVVVMTEFGRTAFENGSRGTDHGTGGTIILAGGALNGGCVWGDWPGLDEAQLLDRRDLMPTRDVRAYAAWALHGLFGTGRAALSSVVFPGLDMGTDPKLLI